MLLGDIFYYDKELEKFPSELSSSTVANVNLLGLGELNPDDYYGMNDTEIRQAIKDHFINKFSQVLTQSSLPKAKAIWQELTSPFFKSNSQSTDYSEFQLDILDWIRGGEKDNELLELVNQTKTLTEEQDLVLGYALKVIYKLSSSNFSGTTTDLNQLKPGKFAEYTSPEPQILILTEPQFFPLFTSQGCLTVAFVEDVKLLSQEIKKVLETHKSIELIMIDTDHDNIVSYLQKDLGTHVFVTSFNLASTGNAGDQTFFDKIVKDTLGVRLT